LATGAIRPRVLEVALDAHILPLLGTKRLNGIGYDEVEALKAKLSGLKRKTVNDVLTRSFNANRVALYRHLLSSQLLELQCACWEQ
jgi:hypothetical protein